MSYARDFLADLRRQASAETESGAFANVRFYAANLHVVGGLIGLTMFIPLWLGELSRAVAPAAVVLVAGGVLGALVHVAGDVRRARSLGTWALICNVLGMAGFFLAIGLTS